MRRPTRKPRRAEETLAFPRITIHQEKSRNKGPVFKFGFFHYYVTENVRFLKLHLPHS